MPRILLVLLLLACGGLAHADAQPPYNFVVFLADDLGARELGCYGNFEHETPHLDRLAAQGIRFRTCWATPLCTPTRVMLLTGQYGWRTGYFDLLGRPYTPRESSTLYDIAEKRTFAHLLDSAGYATCLVGKWQLPGKVPDLVHDCGFDDYRCWAYKHDLPEGVEHIGGWETNPGKGTTSRFWHPCILENGAYRPTHDKEYGPDLFCDFAIDFIKRHQGDRFLVYYPMVLTHKPWDPTPDPEQRGQKTEGGLRANVEHMDRIVGRLVAAVDRLGLGERTVILFTGDNGTQGAGKKEVTERGVRVPLIVRCPGTIPAGQVGDALVSLADVMPTLAEWSNTSLAHGPAIDGRSLVPSLLGEDVVHRPWVYSFLTTKALVRDERWLLDGKGRLWDCGESREGTGYEDATDRESDEARAARTKLEAILETIPGPDAVKGELRLEDAGLRRSRGKPGRTRPGKD